MVKYIIMVSECSQCLVQRAPAEPSQKFGPEVGQTFHVGEIHVLDSPVKSRNQTLQGSGSETTE